MGFLLNDPSLNVNLYPLHSDLGLLKRDRKLQKRYDDWVAGIVKQHGSMGECGMLLF